MDDRIKELENRLRKIDLTKFTKMVINNLDHILPYANMLSSFDTYILVDDVTKYEDDELYKILNIIYDLWFFLPDSTFNILNTSIMPEWDYFIDFFETLEEYLYLKKEVDKVQ